jgi:hypothetical protein
MEFGQIGIQDHALAADQMDTPRDALDGDNACRFRAGHAPTMPCGLSSVKETEDRSRQVRHSAGETL